MGRPTDAYSFDPRSGGNDMKLALPRLILGGLAIHLATAEARLQAQPASLPVDVVADWSYYNNMGWKAMQKGDYDVAEDRFEMAIKQVKPYWKSHHHLALRSYHDLARVLYQQKRYREAEPLEKWVVDVRRKDGEVGMVREDALFDSLYLLAVIHREQEHDLLAEALFHEALQVEEKAVGPNDRALAPTLEDLAAIEFRQGKHHRAELHLRRSLAIRKRTGSSHDPEYVRTLERYAKVLDQLDRGEEAKATEAAVANLRGELNSATP